MQGLGCETQRGYYGVDVELVSRLNDRGITSIQGLSAALGLPRKRALSLLCPTIWLDTNIQIVDYLRLARYLSLDMEWLIDKIRRTDVAEQRRQKRHSRLKLRRSL